MYEVPPDINKEYILQRVSQQEIFEHYLDIKVDLSKYVRSPLRKDEHPTCNFSWFGGKLWFRDWSESRPMDCFQIVKRLYNANLFEATQIIYKDLIKKSNKQRKVSSSLIPKVQKTGEKPLVQTHVCPYKKEDIDYLAQYNIDLNTARFFQIYSIDRIWINKRLVWAHRKNNPALGYYFGKAGEQQRWKVYFYKKKTHRFITNTNRINGWIQLPDNGNLLVITKSLKDVASLYTFGISSIAMQNESTIPYDYIIGDLENRFDNIVSLYDYDLTGVRNANKLYKLYSIPYLFFKNVEGVKDFSDYVKLNGNKKTKELINEVIKKNLAMDQKDRR